MLSIFIHFSFTLALNTRFPNHKQNPLVNLGIINYYRNFALSCEGYNVVVKYTHTRFNPDNTFTSIYKRIYVRKYLKTREWHDAECTAEVVQGLSKFSDNYEILVDEIRGVIFLKFLSRISSRASILGPIRDKRRSFHLLSILS